MVFVQRGENIAPDVDEKSHSPLATPLGIENTATSDGPRFIGNRGFLHAVNPSTLPVNCTSIILTVPCESKKVVITGAEVQPSKVVVVPIHSPHITSLGCPIGGNTSSRRISRLYVALLGFLEADNLDGKG